MKTDRCSCRALIIGGIAVLLIAAASAPHPPLALYNRTPSMPAGLYVYHGHVIRRGAIVAFPLPVLAYDYARRRGEGTDLLLLKHVLAVGGDFVSTSGGELRVNGTPIGRIPPVDSAGRPLPQWRQARVLGDGELLVGSTVDRSFDSRFFGPIRTSQVLGVYRHLAFDSSTHEPITDRSRRVRSGHHVPPDWPKPVGDRTWSNDSEKEGEGSGNQ